MSKSSASVVVTALFNILIWVAPGIPERSRFVIFCVTAVLFVTACIWWAVAHWSKPKTQPVTTSAYGHRPTGGNVATAGRDVHQMIYHAGASRTAQITFAITADYTCYSDNQWVSGRVRFLYAKVSIDHGSVLCSAYFTKIAKGCEVKWEHGPEQLTFGDHAPGDPLPRWLYHGFDYNLDVLAINCKTNEIQVCNDRRYWLRRPGMHKIFAEKGDYILTIGLAGDGAQSRTAELCFNWTGNWQTSFLKFDDEGSSDP